MFGSLRRARAWRPRALHSTRLHRTLLTKAFAVGPTTPPLLKETVPQNFARIVSSFGDRPAVVSRHQQHTLTYDGLDQLSNSLARGLVKAGVVKGARVAVSLGNNIEFAAITYALFKLGAILVPLNPAFTSKQVSSALNHLSATHLVIGAETNLPFKPPASNIPLVRDLVPDLSSSKLASESVPALQSIIFVDNSHGRQDLSELRATELFQNVVEDGGSGVQGIDSSGLSADEVVNIQFTSGTTAMPKAACLMHSCILNNGKSIGDRMLLTEKDAVVCPPPLYHCFGSILGYMATATHGASIIFPTEAFAPLESLLAVQEYKATALYGVPTMFNAMLNLINSDSVPITSGFGSLRTGIAAGSPVPISLMKKLHSFLNLTDLTICYGMTETSPVSAMTTTDDPLIKRTETVGRLLPHVRAKVVDAHDRTRLVDVGEKGELVVAGYLLMKGYWADQARTDEVVDLAAADPTSSSSASDEQVRWMHTGDEAIMDADGYVAITGRLKEIIIRGGENIAPLEIENCLLGHPDIVDISAVGVPDAHYGEVVGVFVIVKKGKQLLEEEVRQWCAERISRHLVPKYVFFTESVPKTPSGKVQRFKLKDEAIELLKAKDA